MRIRVRNLCVMQSSWVKMKLGWCVFPRWEESKRKVLYVKRIWRWENRTQAPQNRAKSKDFFAFFLGTDAYSQKKLHLKGIEGKRKKNQSIVREEEKILFSKEIFILCISILCLRGGNFHAIFAHTDKREGKSATPQKRKRKKLFLWSLKTVCARGTIKTCPVWCVHPFLSRSSVTGFFLLLSRRR